MLVFCSYSKYCHYLIDSGISEYGLALNSLATSFYSLPLIHRAFIFQESSWDKEIGIKRVTKSRIFKLN